MARELASVLEMDLTSQSEQSRTDVNAAEDRPSSVGGNEELKAPRQLHLQRLSDSSLFDSQASVGRNSVL